MHDPMTVAWEIRRPWPYRSKLDGRPFYPSIITIWHVDPESDGSDDSCDWHHRSITGAERDAALQFITNEFDNLGSYFGAMDVRDQEDILLAQWRAARRYLKPRPWWRHPRWHIWHWKIQIHFIQALKRYLFSRCCKCGGRFSWGYTPMSGGWGGGGPRWFRSEERVYHHECDSTHGMVANA